MPKLDASKHLGVFSVFCSVYVHLQALTTSICLLISRCAVEKLIFLLHDRWSQSLTKKTTTLFRQLFEFQCSYGRLFIRIPDLLYYLDWIKTGCKNELDISDH